jgi:hypothetical protein
MQKDQGLARLKTRSVKKRLKGQEIKGTDTFLTLLCDLRAVDEKSTSSQPIMDYATWFANRPE